MRTLGDLADALLSCVCTALEDADRPACACYATIGPPIVGPCCECEEGSGISGDLTINFEAMYPADANTLDRVTRVYPCRTAGAVAADFTLVLTRCYPVLGEDGQLPSPEEQATAADGLHDDGDVLWRALTCCPDVRLRWRDMAVASDPEGGCSMIGARVTVEVTGGSGASR